MTSCAPIWAIVLTDCKGITVGPDAVGVALGEITLAIGVAAGVGVDSGGRGDGVGVWLGVWVGLGEATARRVDVGVFSGVGVLSGVGVGVCSTETVAAIAPPSA